MHQVELLQHGGPRAPELQQLVMDLRSTLPDKEDPSFEDAQKAIYEKMRTQYVEDAKLWNYVYESFKEKVAAVL